MSTGAAAASALTPDARRLAPDQRGMLPGRGWRLAEERRLRRRIDVGPHPLDLVALELEDLDRAAAIDAAAALRLVLPLRHHDVALGDEVAQPEADPLGADSRQQLMAPVVPALEAPGAPGRAWHFGRAVLGLVLSRCLVVAAVVPLTGA